MKTVMAYWKRAVMLENFQTYEPVPPIRVSLFIYISF